MRDRPDSPISAKQHSAAHQPSESTLDWTGRKRFNVPAHRTPITLHLTDKLTLLRCSSVVTLHFGLTLLQVQINNSLRNENAACA